MDRIPKKRLRGPARKITEQELMQEMSVELSQLVFDFLGEMGLSKKRRFEAFAEAMKVSRRPKPSRTIMKNALGLSDLLSTWRSDKNYTGEDGAPRVLPIYGKGFSLETLARRFLPDSSLTEVVTIICQQGEVRKYSTDKVALVGSSVIQHSKSAEHYLASYITRVRNLSATTLHNLSIPHAGRGYFNRQVTGVLAKKDFNIYAQELRGSLQDLCEHVDAGLKLPEKGKRGGKDTRACGVVIYLFQEDGPLFSDG